MFLSREMEPRPSTSPDAEFMVDFVECKGAIIRLMRGARDCVYYSTFLCDLNEPLKLGESSIRPPTFLELIEECVQRGVRVFILFNPMIDYGQSTSEDFLAKLPPGVDVRCVRGDLGPNWLTKWFSNNTVYGYHHQVSRPPYFPHS